jgi:hypothetical protein
MGEEDDFLGISVVFGCIDSWWLQGETDEKSDVDI